jgi:hypothetical protein
LTTGCDAVEADALQEHLFAALASRLFRTTVAAQFAFCRILAVRDGPLSKTIVPDL